MWKRRRPIIVQATIEPGGAQISDENGGEVLPLGVIVPWDRLGNIAGYRHVLDENNHKLEIDNRPFIIRFGSISNSQSKSSQQLINQYKYDWYSNPENEFEIYTVPDGVKATAVRESSFEFAFGGLILIKAALAFRPILNNPNSVTQTMDRWIMLSIFLLGATLITSGFIRYVRTINLSWVVAVRHDGIRVRTNDQERLISWDKIKLMNRKIVLQPLRIDDRDVAVVYPTVDIRSVLISRMGHTRPKLFKAVFFFVLLIAVFSGPFAQWFYQYLQIPMNISWVAVSGICALFAGILPLQNYLVLKGIDRSNGSRDRDFPMNS